MTAAVSFNLSAARATLRTLLKAYENEHLDLETAQVSLRFVSEELLSGWCDSPEANLPSIGLSLMFGASLAALAEIGAWAQCCESEGGEERLSVDVIELVRQALQCLDRVAAAAAPAKLEAVA